MSQVIPSPTFPFSEKVADVSTSDDSEKVIKDLLKKYNLEEVLKPKEVK